MRVLMVLLALVAMPFVASVSQEHGHRKPKDSHGVRHAFARGHVDRPGADVQECDNDDHDQQADEANAESGEHADEADDDDCATPPPPAPPGCAVTPPLNAGTTEIHGTVMNATTGIGLANWCVDLTGTVTATVATDASGNYAFLGLPGGTYTVCQEVQSGWTPVFPDASFGTPCPTGFGWTFTLGAGTIASLVNFQNTSP